MKKLLPVLIPLCVLTFSCKMFDEEDIEPPHFDIIIKNSILAKTAWGNGAEEVLFIDDTRLSWSYYNSMSGTWNEMRYIPQRYYIIDSTLIIAEGPYQGTEYAIKMLGNDLSVTPVNNPGASFLLNPMPFPAFYSTAITAAMLIGTWEEAYASSRMVFTSGHLRWTTLTDSTGMSSVLYDGAYQVSDNQLVRENGWSPYWIIMPDNNTIILSAQDYMNGNSKFFRVP
ncbi:MAG: hypothetical protein LBP32_01700 [Spirochaetaceae bacterium]|nr:hypothetical protein [Spirochaetaceae bacterium]